MPVEVWLRTNTRAVLFGMVLPLTIGVVGLLLIVIGTRVEQILWMQGLGGIVVVLSVATVVALVLQVRQPRLAYRDGHLLAWLRGGPPICVPIQFVECFLLGQTPSLLPGKRHARTETSAIIIRIADSAGEWRHQEVKPQLASWCEGYVTIRGTWCEPLSIALVNRLNQRLSEVSRDSNSKCPGP